MTITLLVVSLGIHEAAHGWVALKCGDPTARDLGRITLNPFPHIDPFMTVILPLMLYSLSGGTMMFGGAKPVPVHFHGLRKPYRDMALVALAGPASNFLLAVLFYGAYHLLVSSLGFWDESMLGAEVLWFSVEINLLLAAFNLLPIPPLDGSRVMTFILPAGGIRNAYQRLERFGLLIVVIAITMVPQVYGAINQMMRIMFMGVREIVTVGGLW